MSNRERWIVYPLLFLAISQGIKLQVNQSSLIDTELVRCKQLIVASPDNEPRISAIGDDRSAMVVLLDERGVGRVMLHTDPESGSGRLDFRGPNHTPRASLLGTERGGLLSLVHSDGNLEIVAGYPNQAAGGGLIARRHGELVREGDGPLWGIVLPEAAAREAPSDESPTAGKPGP